MVYLYNRIVFENKKGWTTDIILRKINQTQKIPYIIGFHLDEMSRTGKSLEMINRLEIVYSQEKAELSRWKSRNDNTSPTNPAHEPKPKSHVFIAALLSYWMSNAPSGRDLGKTALCSCPRCWQLADICWPHTLWLSSKFSRERKSGRRTSLSTSPS